MAERRGACERPPLPLLPLLIASCGEAGEARRGVGRGINCTHSPTSRGYRALMARGNRRRKTCERFGPQKIRAQAEARGWRAPACDDAPSRACAGRPA